MAVTFLTNDDREELEQMIAEMGESNPDSGQNPTVEPAYGDIPKVFFGAPLQKTKDEIISEFWYYSKTLTFRCYAKIKAQGDSTMAWPKKNQSVKLYEDADCTKKLKIDFMGWGAQNKFVIKAYWIDLTQVRDVGSVRLESECAKSRTHYAEMPELLRTSPNMGAVDGFPVVVYAGGVYQGRYMWNIPKDKWMANMDDELDTHCILCSEGGYNSTLFRSAAVIDGTDWSDEIHDTVPESIKARWNEVISFVQNSTNEEFVANLDNYIDVESLIDRYLVGLLSCDYDGFGKNQLYMTYDGLKWYAVPYDKDGTWGAYYAGTPLRPSDYGRVEYEDMILGRGGNLLFMRLEELFIDQLNARWEYLRGHELSAANVIARIRELADITPPHLIAEDYAETTADGAFAKIPGQDVNNIQQIQNFVAERHAWTDRYVHRKFAGVQNCWNLAERTEFRGNRGSGTYYFDCTSPTDTMPVGESVWFNGGRYLGSGYNFYENGDVFQTCFSTLENITDTSFTLTTNSSTELCVAFPFHLLAGETITISFTRDTFISGGYMVFNTDGTHRESFHEYLGNTPGAVKSYEFTATDECYFAWVVGRYDSNTSIAVSDISVTIV